MRNYWIDNARRSLRKLMDAESDSFKRKFIHDTLDDINRGAFTYEQWILDAKMIGIRNPAFEGDYIGYPEDDFDNPEMKHFKRDDESDETNSKK
jgi:hypothetical protein